MRALRLLTLLLVIHAPGSVSAEELCIGFPLRLDITSTTNAAWHTNNGDASPLNDDYGELTERFNLALATGPWLAGLRFDTATFASVPTPAMKDRYALEKAWIGWSGRTAEVTLGDVYVSLGRGLALSIRKIDELGVDTTVRGGRALVGAGPLAATVVAGYANIQNVDEASGLSIGDPFDLLAGSQLQLNVDGTTLGVQGSAVAFRDELSLLPGRDHGDRYYQFGPSLDAPRLSDVLGLYIEGIAQYRDSAQRDDGRLGFGLYAAATLHGGPATIVFEGKAYGDLEPVKPRLPRSEFASIAYNSPPTLERVQQLLENPQKDIYGGRVRADVNLTRSVFGHISYGYFRDELGYADPRVLGEHRPGHIHDPYAGFELHWDGARSRARVSAGIRAVLLADTQQLVRSDGHVEVDIVQALDENWSVELHGMHTERKKHESPILDAKFREGTWSAGVHLRRWFSLAAGYDYTTDPSQPKTHYFNGTAQFNFTPSSSLRVTGGAMRGGLKCISGVCRTVPAFEGLRVILTLRY